MRFQILDRAEKTALLLERASSNVVLFVNQINMESGGHPRIQIQNRKIQNRTSKHFDLQIADQLEQFELSVDLPFKKLYMGHVGRELI